MVEGHLEVRVDRERLLHIARPAAGRAVEFDVTSMADAICAVFCAPRRLAPTSGIAVEIHRRQHLEIASAILEAKGAPS